MASTMTMTAISQADMPSNIRPIIERARQLSQDEQKTEFDPALHLSYKEPSEIIMMRDLGLPEDCGVSPMAVSQPFQLFSQNAVDRMREEILASEVMEKCQFSSNLAACQLRGYANKYAPFVRDAWTHPETLSIMSKLAGIDLVPAMDYEIGHVNVSVKSQQQTKEELAHVNEQRKFFAEDEGIAGCPWEDDKPVVGWHNDSYPFVCVLMLSDCTGMIGGETALQTGNGEILKVRGPTMGCAVVMQGRYITHQALRALGAQERITMVTSFRPRDASYRDDSVLDTVRPISDLSELYFGFGEYRLAILEERVRKKLAEIRARMRGGKQFKTSDFKNFCEEQEKFFAHTNHEMIVGEQNHSGNASVMVQ